MLSALLPYFFLVAGLTGALALFLGMKRELHAQARLHRESLDQVLARLQQAERAAPHPVHAEAPAPAAFRPGINVHKRIQALRLLRRGEDTAHIAAALGVPRREVELLIRVQQLSAKRAAGAS